MGCKGDVDGQTKVELQIATRYLYEHVNSSDSSSELNWPVQSAFGVGKES